jgi:simple sugar transport system permease protein
MKRALPALTAFLAAVIVIVTFLALSASSPADTVAAFLSRPFSSWWHFGNLLNASSLILLAALGSKLALDSGMVNLGGEAQVFAPALLTAVTLNAAGASFPSIAGASFPNASGMVNAGLLIATALASASLGALLAAGSAALRVRRGVSELLSSFLLSAAALPVLDYLVSGPLRDQSKNLLATASIPEAFRLEPFLRPSYLNASFAIAIAIAVSLSLFLSRSRAGYRMRLTGAASEFALYSGIATDSYRFFAMTASGALHGLSGFFSVVGTAYACHQGHSGGLGWSALAVALMARSGVAFVIPAAVLFAWLESASDSALLSTRFSFDSTSIVQAVLLLAISARLMIRRPRARFETRMTLARPLKGVRGERRTREAPHDR